LFLISEITKEDKVILLASDGLWDVLSPKLACELAIQAKNAGRSATQELVARAIRDMPNCNVADNITVIAIFVNS
jgi:serine/threonine protein phosphatase PrpC